MIHHDSSVDSSTYSNRSLAFPAGGFAFVLASYLAVRLESIPGAIRVVLWPIAFFASYLLIGLLLMYLNQVFWLLTMRTETRTLAWFLADSRCRKWIVQCSACGQYGRKPETPNTIPKFRFEEMFPLMTLDDSLICEVCRDAENKVFVPL